MRVATVVLAAVLLAGCIMISSALPLFSAADAAGQAQLRPGLWVSAEKGCDVDTRQLVDTWSDCVEAFVVRPGEIVTARRKGDQPGDEKHLKTLFARGDPPVWQIGVTAEDGQTGYFYLGVRVLKLDRQGRVVAYQAWPALCGPPPPPDPTGQHDAGVPRELIAGLVMDKDQDCTASAQAPVRLSARESEAWSRGDDNRGRDTARWVRDAET